MITEFLHLQRLLDTYHIVYSAIETPSGSRVEIPYGDSTIVVFFDVNGVYSHFEVWHTA